jgi:hypothetical protein
MGREIVAASVPKRTLEDTAYQQAVDILERHSDTLAAARQSVQADPDVRESVPSPSLRNSS